jgi:hypothetical protein
MTYEEFKKKFMVCFLFLIVIDVVLLIIAIPLVEGQNKCRSYWKLGFYLDIVISFLAAPNIFL